MSKDSSLGVINHGSSDRRTDYLYRISIKGLIRNNKGEVLVVKESGRDWWDLPGGGMDHAEDIHAAIARELNEEVNLEGNFTHKVIEVEDPAYLSEHDFWQLRLVFEVKPENMQFSPGDDGDEVGFMNPKSFKGSALKAERLIYKYCNIAAQSS